jgi:hypothetical protein
LPTKVEFSRRHERGDGQFETALIDTEIARPYRKLAYRCQHYAGSAAVLQKVMALAGRPVTQARDVFDLGILFRGGHRASGPLPQLLSESEFTRAIDCLTGLTWDDYQGQVMEFLDSDSREEYGSKSAWDSLQDLVLSQLEADA